MRRHPHRGPIASSCKIFGSINYIAFPWKNASLQKPCCSERGATCATIVQGPKRQLDACEIMPPTTTSKPRPRDSDNQLSVVTVATRIDQFFMRLKPTYGPLGPMLKRQFLFGRRGRPSSPILMLPPQCIAERCAKNDALELLDIYTA